MAASADPTLHKLQLRAEEYRARAREALAVAESTTLERVREQRQAAAVIWTDLADAEEARLVTRRVRLSESDK